MTVNCVACGGEAAADAVRCPSCGLAFTPEREGTFVPSAGPDHIGLYVGQPPVLEQDEEEAALAEWEEPRRPSRAGGRARRAPVGAAFLVVAMVAALAAAALYVATRRPNDSWTQLEMDLEWYANTSAISGVTDPPALDPDAELRALERSNRQAFAAARAAHRPLPAPDGPSLHGFAETLVKRLADVSRDRVYEFGVPAAEEEVSPDEETALAAETLVCADAWRAVKAWRGRADLTPHDRADGDALLGWLDDRVRVPSGRDRRSLAWIRNAFSMLPRLELDDSRPAGDRAARAVARLRAAVPRLRAAVASIEHAPHALVLDAAGALEFAERHLRRYPGSWGGLTDAQSAELAEAAASACACAGESAALLRTAAASRATRASGMGAETLARRLRTYHGLDLSPREAYERALDELRTAHDDLRAVWEAAERDVSAPSESEIACVDRLRAAIPHWITEAPSEPPPRILATPEMWEREDAAAWYMDPGLLGPAGTGTILVSRHDEEPGDERAREWAMPRRHLFAHETYPGHRLQAVMERASCVVRRLVDDRMSREGWACYAQDLIHETGDCAGGPRDERARANERLGVAVRALTSILVATGAASDDAVLGLLAQAGYQSPTIDEVGAIAAWSDYPLCYLLGADEIRALRREEEERLGDRFDLRAFHTRFLREGPIPVPLIRRQWREEDERR